MSFNTLCRVCAHPHSENHLVDIFKACREGETIAEGINELTGLKVEEGDGWPNLCCIQCQSDVFRSVDTRRKCINSEKAIEALLQDDTLQPGTPEFEPEDSLYGIIQEASKTSSSDERTAYIHNGDESNYSLIVTSIEETLDLHESTESSCSEEAIRGDNTITPETNRSNRQCCGCSLCFDNEDDLMEHSRLVHAPNAPLADKTKPVQCNICYSWYKTKRNVRDHQLYMCKRQFKCTICGMQFGRASALLRHKNTHEKALIFPCKHCGKLFHTVYRRLIHQKRDHNKTSGTTNTPPVESRTCCGCGQNFDNENELQEHAHSVHAPNAPQAVKNKPAQCSVCYRWYKSMRDVRIHQLNWRKRVLQCATCGKKYSRPSVLAEHENGHNKALLFPCRECDQKFTNKSARQRHEQRTHAPQESTTTPQHVCTQCGKSFYSAGYLKQHMNLHTDENPYKCRCGAQFKIKIYLTRHMKIHSGQYTCKYCSIAFACASLLKGHENSHTGNKEFSCEICGKHFYSKADARKHRQKVHEKKKRRQKASSG